LINFVPILTHCKNVRTAQEVTLRKGRDEIHRPNVASKYEGFHVIGKFRSSVVFISTEIRNLTYLSRQNSTLPRGAKVYYISLQELKSREYSTCATTAWPVKTIKYKSIHISVS
jgi:hypothetical protein